MTKEEYIQTITINGIKVDIGVDDYGQCYFYEYKNNDGTLISRSCGTYNASYLEDIYYTLDPIYHSVSKKDIFGDVMTPEEQDKLKEYNIMFDKIYREVIKNS